MAPLVEEIKKNRLCMLFWDEQIEYELNLPVELSYEPVGEMGVFSKEYRYNLPYKGNDNRFKGLSAILEIKITSNQKEYVAQSENSNSDFYYNVKLTIKKDEERLLVTKFALFSCNEPVYYGRESALKLFLV